MAARVFILCGVYIDVYDQFLSLAKRDQLSDRGQAGVTHRARWMQAMARAYDEHASQVYRLAYYLSGDPRDAEDLLQEAFVRVFSKIRRLKPDADLRMYLDRTVINLARSQWRQRGRESRLSLSPHDRFNVGLPFEERDQLWHDLRHLPNRQKAVLFLKHYEGLTEAEIATRMDCSVAAVRSLAHRALATLRKEISRNES